MKLLELFARRKSKLLPMNPLDASFWQIRRQREESKATAERQSQ